MRLKISVAALLIGIFTVSAFGQARHAVRCRPKTSYQPLFKEAEAINVLAHVPCGEQVDVMYQSETKAYEVRRSNGQSGYMLQDAIFEHSEYSSTLPMPTSGRNGQDAVSTPETLDSKPTQVPTSGPPSTAAPQLTPLPQIGDLEKAAAAVPMTPEKCEATLDAYTGAPAVLNSISDEAVHKLNAQALACMQLGREGIRYGYQLKTIVDVAYATQRETGLLQAIAELGRQDREERTLVDQYNDLVAKYNHLFEVYEQTYNIAENVIASALREANRPALPVFAAPPQPQTLRCMTQSHYWGYGSTTSFTTCR